MASTALPAPKSATVSPVRITLCINRTTPRVVGCSPVPKALAGALRFLSRGGPLGLSRVTIRSAARTGDVEIDLWAQPGPFPRAAVAKTLSSAVRFETLTRVLARGDVKARDVSNVEVLSGQGYLRERMNDFEYRVSAPSFFQVNTPVAEAMTPRLPEDLGADAGGPLGSHAMRPGRGQIRVDTPPTAAHRAKSGKLTGLAVTSLKRSPLAPEIHTMDEAGVPGYEATAWFGVVGPAGMPHPVVDRLHAGLLKALRDARNAAKGESRGPAHIAPAPGQCYAPHRDAAP